MGQYREEAVRTSVETEADVVEQRTVREDGLGARVVETTTTIAAPGGCGVAPFRGGIAVDCRRPTALVACGAVVAVEEHSMSKVTRPPRKGDRASQTRDSLVSGTVASWPGPFSPRWAMTTVDDGATRAAAESPEVPDDDSS